MYFDLDFTTIKKHLEQFLIICILVSWHFLLSCFYKFLLCINCFCFYNNILNRLFLKCLFFRKQYFMTINKVVMTALLQSNLLRSFGWDNFYLRNYFRSAIEEKDKFDNVFFLNYLFNLAVFAKLNKNSRYPDGVLPKLFSEGQNSGNFIQVESYINRKC